MKLYGFVALSHPDSEGLNIMALSFFMAAIFETGRLIMQKSLLPAGTFYNEERDLNAVAMGFYVFLAVIMTFLLEGGFIWTE